LNGHGIRGRDARGQHIVDEHFVLYFSAHDAEVECTLPSAEFAPAWQVIIDTAGHIADDRLLDAGTALTLCAKSLVVLRAATEPVAEPDHSVAASVANSSPPPAQPA
jgi:glycogen operon protein